MCAAPNLQDHRLLRGLPPGEHDQLLPGMEVIDFSPGEVVCRIGDRINFVYFLRNGAISLFADLADAPCVGVGMIVSQGVVGLSAPGRRRKSDFLAVSQGDAAAYRIDAVFFDEQLPKCPALGLRVYRYALNLANQFAIGTACASTHSSELRLARWMLDVTDGLRCACFSSTQGAMANAIGVQRPAVSKVAGRFQALGLIEYVRGEVTVLDRVGLIKMACSCNAKGIRFS